jgi:hypothetical protein
MIGHCHVQIGRDARVGVVGAVSLASMAELEQYWHLASRFAAIRQIQRSLARHKSIILADIDR